MRYTQLVDFVVKVTWAIEENCKLLESGFQYVCDHDTAKIFQTAIVIMDTGEAPNFMLIAPGKAS